MLPRVCGPTRIQCPRYQNNVDYINYSAVIWTAKYRQSSCHVQYFTCTNHPFHYSGVIISVMASQITGVSLVYSTVCSGADQSKHQSSASLAFVRGSHRWPVNSPHIGPVTWKMFPFDDVVMRYECETKCALMVVMRVNLWNSTKHRNLANVRYISLVISQFSRYQNLKGHLWEDVHLDLVISISMWQNPFWFIPGNNCWRLYDEVDVRLDIIQ